MTEGDESQNDSPTWVTVTDSQRFDEIFMALADTQRRQILSYLQDEQRSTLTGVANQLAAWKHDIPPDDVSDESRDDLRTVLHHKQLPKLDDLQLIEYDPRSKKIVFRDLPELVALCLDHCAPQDLPA